MAISSLEVQDFRNLKAIHIHTHPLLNLIIGPNGSGKTSLLEAIHCLGRGKSFRTHKTNRLIRDGCDAFTVLGRINQMEREFSIGMQRKKGESQIRLAGRSISRTSELTQALPIAVLEPGMHRLIEEGPEHRRKFLDWGVFHVEQSFHQIWTSYRHVLAQRNAALRSGQPHNAIKSWDRELVQSAQRLDKARRKYLEKLLQFVPRYIDKFTDLSSVEIYYQQGWREGESYSDYLAAQYNSDRERGFTQFGPHRADLRLRVQGVDTREFLSRGQQKILVAALVLAQCEQMKAQNTSVVVLVDDLPSELDKEKREILLQCLVSSQAQVFITATDTAFFPIEETDHLVFHVKQGQISSI